MREIINVHIGQAGVKLGEALWELFCLDHGVSRDASLSAKPNCSDLLPESIFYEANGKFFPRALFVDTEPDAIDSLRGSPNGALFNPAFLVSGKESAANSFARGSIGSGDRILEEALHQIRRMVERCDSFQGFVFSRSISGGTGSGYAARLIDHLTSEYPQRTRFEVAVFPSPNTSAIPVEPYNAVLSTHATLETIDCSFVVDNEAVYKLLGANLKHNDAADDRNLNLLIARAISTATIGLRALGEHTMSMNEFVTNLVPFRRLHYSGLSFSPVIASPFYSTPIGSMVRDLLNDRSNLVSCEFNKGRYLAGCLFHRHGGSSHNVQHAIIKMKSLIEPLCPLAVKLSHISCPPEYPENSVFHGISEELSMLSTSTAFKSVFQRMARKFSLMFSKRAFTHAYFAEGMRDEDFMDALDDVRDLIHEYKKQEEDTSDESLSSNTDGI